MTSTSVSGLPFTTSQKLKGDKERQSQVCYLQKFQRSQFRLQQTLSPQILLLLFSHLMICHKNELTLATNLSMVVNLIAQSVDLTISLPPNEDYVPNTKGSVSLILLRSLGWLTPLVNVSSKMARFPAKRQTNEPPWKQTTSTLKI